MSNNNNNNNIRSMNINNNNVNNGLTIRNNIYKYYGLIYHDDTCMIFIKNVNYLRKIIKYDIEKNKSFAFKYKSQDDCKFICINSKYMFITYYEILYLFNIENNLLTECKTDWIFIDTYSNYELNLFDNKLYLYRKEKSVITVADFKINDTGNIKISTLGYYDVGHNIENLLFDNKYKKLYFTKKYDSYFNLITSIYEINTEELIDSTIEYNNEKKTKYIEQILPDSVSGKAGNYMYIYGDNIIVFRTGFTVEGPKLSIIKNFKTLTSEYIECLLPDNTLLLYDSMQLNKFMISTKIDEDQYQYSYLCEFLNFKENCSKSIYLPYITNDLNEISYDLTYKINGKTVTKNILSCLMNVPNYFMDCIIKKQIATFNLINVETFIDTNEEFYTIKDHIITFFKLNYFKLDESKQLYCFKSGIDKDAISMIIQIIYYMILNSIHIDIKLEPIIVYHFMPNLPSFETISFDEFVKFIKNLDENILKLEPWKNLYKTDYFNFIKEQYKNHKWIYDIVKNIFSHEDSIYIDCVNKNIVEMYKELF